MNKKDYKNPELWIVSLECMDVITTSYKPGENELPIDPVNLESEVS